MDLYSKSQKTERQEHGKTHSVHRKITISKHVHIKQSDLHIQWNPTKVLAVWFLRNKTNIWRHMWKYTDSQTANGCWANTRAVGIMVPDLTPYCRAIAWRHHGGVVQSYIVQHHNREQTDNPHIQTLLFFWFYNDHMLEAEPFWKTRTLKSAKELNFARITNPLKNQLQMIKSFSASHARSLTLGEQPFSLWALHPAPMQPWSALSENKRQSPFCM